MSLSASEERDELVPNATPKATPKEAKRKNLGQKKESLKTNVSSYLPVRSMPMMPKIAD